MQERLHTSRKIEVRSSALHGRGVFATAAIRAGELLEECHFALLDSCLAATEPWLNSFLFTWPRGGARVAVVFGFGSIYNHSSRPNIAFSTDVGAAVYRFHAIRDISPGEELCHDYGPHAAGLRDARGALDLCRGDPEPARGPRVLILSAPGRSPHEGDPDTAFLAVALRRAGVVTRELHASLQVPPWGGAAGPAAAEWRRSCLDLAVARSARSALAGDFDAVLLVASEAAQRPGAAALGRALCRAGPGLRLLAAGRHAELAPGDAAAPWVLLPGDPVAELDALLRCLDVRSSSLELLRSGLLPDYEAFLVQRAATGWDAHGRAVLPLRAPFGASAGPAAAAHLARVVWALHPTADRLRWLDGPVGDAWLVELGAALAAGPASELRPLRLDLTVEPDVLPDHLADLRRAGVCRVAVTFRGGISGAGSPTVVPGAAGWLCRAAELGLPVDWTLLADPGCRDRGLPLSLLSHLPPPVAVVGGIGDSGVGPEGRAGPEVLRSAAFLTMPHGGGPGLVVAGKDRWRLGRAATALLHGLGQATGAERRLHAAVPSACAREPDREPPDPLLRAAALLTFEARRWAARGEDGRWVRLVPAAPAPALTPGGDRTP